MATFDLTKTEGLPDACREAERQLDQSPKLVEKTAEIAEFLQRVQETTAEERASGVFLRLIWEQSPIYGASKTLSAEAALTDPEFRRWFCATTDGPAPEDAKERVAWLDERMREV